jgi:hypothetical protein
MITVRTNNRLKARSGWVTFYEGCALIKVLLIDDKTHGTIRRGGDGSLIATSRIVAATRRGAINHRSFYAMARTLRLIETMRL